MDIDIYIYILYSCVNKFYCGQFPLLREREKEGERGWGYNDRDSVCSEENLKVCKDKLV